MAKHRQPHGPPMTRGNMRKQGVRGLALYCLNPRCLHRSVLNVDNYPANTLVQSFGPKMVCAKCGTIGADAVPGEAARYSGMKPPTNSEMLDRIGSRQAPSPIGVGGRLANNWARPSQVRPPRPPDQRTRALDCRSSKSLNGQMFDRFPVQTKTPTTRDGRGYLATKVQTPGE